MDPNANLAEQQRILDRGLTRGATYYYVDQSRLAELRRALCDWLRRGGFAPDWAAHPRGAESFKDWAARNGLRCAA